MAKIEDRPVDAGLAGLKGKSDAEILDWMKQRQTLTAAVPTDVARAGAMLPMLRELSRLTPDERRRITKIRLQAFQQLPRDQQEKLVTARKLGNASDPELLESDTAVIRGLKGEVPGVDEILDRLGA
jgi:hypothetical protein